MTEAATAFKAGLRKSQDQTTVGTELTSVFRRFRIDPDKERFEKFAPSIETLVVGDPLLAASGVTKFLNVSVNTRFELAKEPLEVLEAIRREWKDFQDPDVDSMIEYILYLPAVETEEQSNDGKTLQIRDQGNEGKRLEDFLQAPQAAAARLTVAHLAALRIYTSWLFKHIQSPLRKHVQERHSSRRSGLQREHPAAVTVFLIHQALLLLRVNCGDIGEGQTYWRGLRNLKLDSKFMEVGGTEVPCMSTSKDIKIVAQYARSLHPIILCIKVDSFMHSGADISWVSLYPSEQEVLFPPLTYLKPIRQLKIQNHYGYVIEVTPTLS